MATIYASLLHLPIRLSLFLSFFLLLPHPLLLFFIYFFFSIFPILWAKRRQRKLIFVEEKFVKDFGTHTRHTRGGKGIRQEKEGKGMVLGKC